MRIRVSGSGTTRHLIKYDQLRHFMSFRNDCVKYSCSIITRRFQYTSPVAHVIIPPVTFTACHFRNFLANQNNVCIYHSVTQSV